MLDDFKEMPIILKFITAHGLFCFLFFLSAVVPGFDVNFTYKGQTMDFEEIWQSGIGGYLIFIGLFFPVSAILLLKRSHYGRQLYSFVLLSAFVIPNVSGGHYIYLPLALFVPCILIIYLFKYSKVRQYYGT